MLRDGKGLSTGHSPDKWSAQIAWFQGAFPSHCYVEGESVELGCLTFPSHSQSLSTHQDGKPLSWSFLHPADPRGPCLVQPAQVNPIFWSPISCCAVWFGMHSVLSYFLCIHIFIPTQRLETWLRFPRKNLGQWQSQGKKLTNKSFHFPAVSIHRCRDFGYTFNFFCDLGQITCLPLDFSFLISKARGWTRKISYNNI